MLWPKGIIIIHISMLYIILLIL